jgi:hypothetical protein
MLESEPEPELASLPRDLSGSVFMSRAELVGRCIIPGLKSKLLIEDRERSNHAGK